MAQDRPALEVALLRFVQLAGKFVDPGEHSRRRQHRLAQLCPAIDVGLRKIRIIEQSAKPRILLVIQLRPKPVLRQPAFLSVGVAKTQIPIPERPHLNTPIAVLVIKRAEAKPVHILRRFHDDVVVDERSRLNERAVTPFWIGEIRPIQRCLKPVQIILQPRFLHSRQLVRVWFNKKELITQQRRPEPLLFHGWSRRFEKGSDAAGAESNTEDPGYG